jgi:hypothetical protein
MAKKKVEKVKKYVPGRHIKRGFSVLKQAEGGPCLTNADLKCFARITKGIVSIKRVYSCYVGHTGIEVCGTPKAVNKWALDYLGFN